MPLYEYECSQCRRRIEKIQKFSDPELTVCPHCGGQLERTLTAPNVQFKGGGWYKDLYSSAKPPAANAATGGDSNAPAAPPESGSGSAASSDSSAASSSTAPASTPAAAPASTPAAPSKS